VTLEAAEKAPTSSRRPAWRVSWASSSSRSTWPSPSSPTATTSAGDSRQGSRFGVVLVGAHEHHRPVAGRAGPAVQLQQADQLGHGRRRPRPAEDDQVLCGPAHGLVDHLAGLLAQPRRVVSGARALGVGVGVPGQDPVADGVLDEAQGPARGGPVGVGDAPRPVGPGQHLAVADDRRPDPLHQGGRRVGAGAFPLGQVDGRHGAPLVSRSPVAAAPGPSARRQGRPPAG
jgi:hypothetical protein